MPKQRLTASQTIMGCSVEHGLNIERHYTLFC